MIQICALEKSFGTNLLFHNLNIEIPFGKITGIVGANGAGKTTLFRCLLGLESYSGKIISSIHPLKDKTGYLSAEPYFFPRMTGREYLQFMVNARDIYCTNFDARNVFELPLHQYATTYSTGMKKKLALTGMLLQENELFILDEPFNGLDLQSNIVLAQLLEVLREKQKTVLLSSHIFSTLKESCDQLIYLQKGKPADVYPRESFTLLENELRSEHHYSGGFEWVK
jgi:ABC-2 type transport system ATP-binding protein